MIKKLKKSFVLFVLVMFIAQTVTANMVVTASTTQTGLVIDDVIVSATEEAEQDVEKLTDGQTVYVKMGFTWTPGEDDNKSTSLTVPIQLQGKVIEDGTVFNHAQKEVGSYTIADNQLNITVDESADTAEPFTLTYQASYHATDDLAIAALTFTAGDQTITKTFTRQPIEVSPSSETDTESDTTAETTQVEKETTESTTPTAEPSKKTVKKVAVKEVQKNSVREPHRITENLIKSVAITDKNGAAFTAENPASIDSEVNIDFTWDLPNELDVVAGDTFEFDLPNVFKLYSTVEGDILDDDGAVLGNYVIGTNGHVTITFTEEAATRTDVKGNIKVTTKLKQELITGKIQQELVFPIADEIMSVPITFKPTNGVDISKKGTLDKNYNPLSVKWTIDINTSLTPIVNAVVTDVMPNGLSINKVEVYQLTVDVKGNTTQGDRLDPSKYTVVDGTVTFNDPKITSAYRIMYDTKIDNADQLTGKQTFNNKVTLTGTDKKVNAAASVNANYGLPLVKSESNNDKDKLQHYYEIKYNYNEQPIVQKDATITDSFNNNLTLIGGLDGVQIYPVTIDGNGNPTVGKTAISADKYTIKAAEDATTNGFTVEFKTPITTAYIIKYGIKHTDIVDATTQFSNTVTTGTGSKQTVNGQSVQQGIVKSIVATDNDAETIDWKLTLNNLGYTMNNMKINDTFSSDSLTLVPDTLKLIDTSAANKVLQLGTDYTLTEKTGGKAGFDISFIGDYATTDHKFTLTYQTHYEAFTNTTTKYSNNAQLSWSGTDGKEYKATSSAEYNAPAATKSNGSKSGSYNVASKEITWLINANYNRANLKNAKITDKIPFNDKTLNNQLYVEKSATVYHYSVAKNGGIVKGAALDPSEYTLTTPTAANNYTIEVVLTKNFKGNDSSIALEFKTSLEGQMIKDSYTNTATFTNNEIDYPLTATVSVPKGSELVSKSGKQNGDNIDWVINMNSNQSTSKNYKINDEPSGNQVLNKDSFHVYPAAAATDGSIKTTSEPPLVEGVDYKLTITTDGSTGKQTFELSFKKTISTPYILKYSSYIDANNNEAVTNKVKLSGDNVTGYTTEKTEIINVQMSSGSGNISGVRGGLKIKKVNDEGEIIAGVDFVIYDKSGKTALRSGTTGADGTLAFGGIRAGEYVIKETAAPAGYSINPEYAAGKKVTINVTADTPVMELTVANPKTLVTVKKVNTSGTGLAGANFDVFTKEGLLVLPNLTSDSNGKIAIEGLVEGDYELREKRAPLGYVLNLTPQPFTVALNADGTMVATTVTMTNYQGSITATKTDADGNPLAGALYKVINSKGETVMSTISGNNGQIYLSQIAPGWYHLVESAAPAGYILNSAETAFTIDATDRTQPLTKNLGTIKNYKGKARLIKTDAEGNPLAGAEFAVVNAANEVVAKATSTATGEVNVSDLAPGKYNFIELKAAAGYMLNTAKTPFEINAVQDGEPKLVVAGSLKNYQGSMMLTKVDNDDKPLADAEFTIKNAAGDTVKTAVTGTDGVIKVTNLAPGEYTVVETKAPAGYIRNTVEQPFVITAEAENEPAIVKLGTLANYQGTVTLHKVTAENKPLANATFKVVTKDGKFEKTVVSDEAGTVTVAGLAPGKYSFIETQAPTGYIINTTPIDFEISETLAGKPTVLDAGKLTNYQGEVSLIKTDANDQPLAGAEFKVVNAAGDQVKTATATKDGEVNVSGLAPGKYNFIETKAPTGYIINTTPIAFEIAAEAAGKPAVVDADKAINYQGSVKLVKKDAKGAVIPMAAFDLVNAKGDIIKQVVSDENGEITVTGLAPGEYSFIETAAPKGYVLNTEPINFTVEAAIAGKPAVIDAGDVVNYQGEATLIKQDAAGNALAGAEFTVVNEADEIVEKATSDANGEVTVAGLAPGKYSFIETKAPAGYVLNKTAMPFEVKAAAADKPVMVNVGVMTNYQGAATLLKTDEKGNPLAGAEFTVVDESNEYVKTATSDANGEVTVDGLAPGKYSFIETKAPTGYIINTIPIAFEIEAAAADKPTVVKAANAVNYQGEVRLIKTDANDQPLAGAEFDVINAENKVVQTVVSDEAGKVAVDKLAPGQYNFIETKAPTGYIINTTAIPFEINSEAAAKPAVVDADKAINYQGQASLLKTDANGNGLEGAEFDVVDATDTVVAKAVSDEKGIVKVTDLAPGQYSFIETKAPTGYSLNPVEKAFEIATSYQGAPEVSDAGQLINYQGAISLTKVDENQQPLANAMFEIVNLDLGITVLEDIVSDANGRVNVAGLIPGHYYIKETKAPIGYELSAETREFVIDDVMTEGYVTNLVDFVNKLVVVPTPENELPVIMDDEPIVNEEEILLPVITTPAAPVVDKQTDSVTVVTPVKATTQATAQVTLPSTGDQTDKGLLAVGMLMTLISLVVLRKKRI